MTLNPARLPDRKAAPPPWWVLPFLLGLAVGMFVGMVLEHFAH